MKSFLGFALVAFATIVMVGCSNPEETAKTGTTANSPLTADLCGKCGDAAGSETCCKGETCDCGMQKGSELCCTGVKSADLVYCKGCGFEKGSDKCCAEGTEKCSCGLAKGSPLCCKLKKDDDHAHEGSDSDHDDEHAEGESHDKDAGHDSDEEHK